ncbi:acylneuraminate cytidylyltransferase family protein [Clostridium sartagoforme]|uniref:acylneuraminate cytidylyltransferase family protein n=1 Tax=Clostridium sartagoforme TaxID=84031 RepID=UPI0031DE4B56
MKEILAIIPARSGSKGVPRKNIKDLNGKPLIAYTIEAAKHSKYIDKVIVSTEDIEIKDVAIKFGGYVPFLRPNELATDSSPSIDAILYTINKLKQEYDYFPKYICLLQCTSPLRTAKHIDEAFLKLQQTNMDAVVSVCEAEVNPYWSNIFKGDKLEYFLEKGKTITRRQELPDIYRMNGAIYIIKTDVLMETKTFEPENLTGYIMDDISSIDIDTFLDFKVAEILIREGDTNA